MKPRLLVTLALAGLLSAIPLSRAGTASHTTRDVTRISDGATVGTSTLTRTSSGISFSLQTSGLQAGHVIDDSGTAEFGGRLAVGDSDGAVSRLDGLMAFAPAQCRVRASARIG